MERTTIQQIPLSDYLIMFSGYPDVIDTKTMCQMLDQVSQKLGYRLINSGAVKSVEIGREHRILKLWVIEYLAGKAFSFSDYHNNMFTEYPDMFGIEILCQMLGNISNRLVYRLIKTGTVRSKQIGREFKIAKVWVIEYLINAAATLDSNDDQSL